MRDRGVSPIVNYVLALGIVAILISGLFVSMTGFVEDQRATAVQSELEVVGNRLAADLGTAERLALTAESGTVRLSSTLPDRVAGIRYTAMIEQDGAAGQYRLLLRTEDPDISVPVHLRSRIPIENGTVHGGNLLIAYDDGSDTLEVRDE